MHETQVQVEFDEEPALIGGHLNHGAIVRQRWPRRSRPQAGSTPWGGKSQSAEPGRTFALLQLQLLGHEVRWQLVTELCKSDLKVGELVMATGQAQNLVSYHLRLLRDAGLVHERRSSADGRDIYYSLDRRAAATGLLDALETLNPGAPPSATGARLQRRPTRGFSASVLFLCTGNSARSQIAETMLRALGGRHLLVRSAGTHPAGVHPQVYTVLSSRDLRVGKLRSKSVDEFAGQAFDFVVTLCDIARTQPIDLVGKPHLVHWSIPDPVAARGGRAAVATAFERVTDEIQERVDGLYAVLGTRRSAA
jgi:protein-tyrosine-phosphatase/DNA-binding transcriptional ArsR family regulator